MFELFKDRLQARRENKLGEAIANHDVKRMAEYLALGTKKVDYLLMRDADFGNGKDKIPAGKFNDAWALAKQVGLTGEGARLLEQYIPRPPEAARPNQHSWGI